MSSLTPSLATSIILPPPYSTNPATDPATAQKIKLAGLLNLPTHCVGSGKDATLRVAFEKYHAVLAATQIYETMVAAGTWMVKKLTKSEIIELVVSKSFYFSHYHPCFSKVSEYPNMVAWLENSDEMDDFEVWGVWKDDYIFKDLEFWLMNSGSLTAEGGGKKKGRKEKQSLDQKKEGKKSKRKKGQNSGTK